MKKKYIITILCAFALIISSASVYALWQTQEVKEEKKGDIEPLLQDGIFTAEIGTARDREEPSYYLNGNYQKKDKIISCSGTASIRDMEGEFKGVFKEEGKGRLREGYFFEITITVEEEHIIFSGKYRLDENGEDFQGEWCIGGRDGDRGKDECFEFVYPITYIMPDGSTITIENREDWDEIKAWYEANPDVREEPKLQFPVDIIWPDGTIETINNEEELKGAYEKCDRSGDRDKGETGWITGTFQGLDDNKAKNIPTILERFPILAKLLKMPLFRNIFQILIKNI